MSICAVIIAGGSGTRLWPLSRASHPKQFLSLHDNVTMLQSPIMRLEGLDIQSSLTICNEEHKLIEIHSGSYLVRMILFALKISMIASQSKLN